MVSGEDRAMAILGTMTESHRVKEAGLGNGPTTHHSPLTTHQAGMLTFLASEVAFFGTLIMAYVYFLRQSSQGEPNPIQVFYWPRLWVTVFFSACLFSSSLTIHFAGRALRRSFSWR